MGLGDDIIGVTEAGFKSQQMNVILNVKTAEKGLQFEEQKYLGFILSSKGENMANINAIKKKSIGVIRTIMNKLDSLKLRQYYFECSIIFMNVILRGSILYASETYYNLTEMQLRKIERIEEEYLRKVLKTSKGCHIVQLYLAGTVASSI